MQAGGPWLGTRKVKGRVDFEGTDPGHWVTDSRSGA
jgi:hypothetical protein